MASMDAARPSQGTLANCRAQSQAALYQILGLSPGYRCANSALRRTSRWFFIGCPRGTLLKVGTWRCGATRRRRPLLRILGGARCRELRHSSASFNLGNGMATKLDKTIKREL